MSLWLESCEIARDMLQCHLATQVLYLMFALGFGGWVTYWV